ncbi:hypothetical protein FA95DRAFT_1276325 [Auriscalpium vulgare]|uniref:Uncharacterized protein n=1 Tax=Auriscalpium vulgare TaxID=40419 RepID=A0ACB8RTL0_9AGAM|nr:hypothetical protein FA95DRAFT_1276325 [Auriscalpium vulgare]
MQIVETVLSSPPAQPGVLQLATSAQALALMRIRVIWPMSDRDQYICGPDNDDESRREKAARVGRRRCESDGERPRRAGRATMGGQHRGRCVSGLTVWKTRTRRAVAAAATGTGLIGRGWQRATRIERAASDRKRQARADECGEPIRRRATHC